MALTSLTSEPGGMEAMTNQPRDMTGKDPLTEISSLETIVMRQAEKMQTLEKQILKLREEVDDLRGAPGDATPASTADPDQDPRDLLAVTRRRLDCGDAFRAEMSIWDACLFVGHPAVGWLVSSVAIAVWTLNIALQVWFMVLVYNNMLDPDVTEDKLDALLRYRIAAHSVEYSDELTQNSMIYQVCSDEVPGKLHQSAAQASLYFNLQEFNPSSNLGGKSLMYLAQLIWLCFILKEINQAWNFARSLANVGLGKRTRIVMNEKDAMSGLDDQAAARPEAGNDNAAKVQIEVARTHTGSLEVDHTMMIVCRVCSITRARFGAALAFIVLPRMGIALAMGIVGCLFLGKTSNIEDLVLNAIALLFIADIDNVLYSVFAPRRLQTLMDNLEAFPMPHKNRLATAGMFSIMKICIVSIALLLVYFFILEGFFWRLEMARTVLCGGNTDFVFAIDPASGLVHVARSNDVVPDYTNEERVILQVAAPPIAQDYWTTVSADIVSIANNGSRRAVWQSATDATSYDEAAYSGTYFARIANLESSMTSEAAAALPCADLSSGQDVTIDEVKYDVALTYLRALVPDPSITSCDEVPWHMCAQSGGDQIRALCPVRCGCDKPARYYFAYAGFYQSPGAGCPTQCDIIAGARNEVLYGISSYSEARDTASPPGAYACLDLSDDAFAFSRGCVSADQFDLVRNSEGKTCVTASCSASFDDSDFTAGDMCCKCGGGITSTPGHRLADSLTCLDNLTDDCQHMDLPSFYYLMWVRGLKDYLQSTTEYIDQVNSTVYHEADLIGLNESEKGKLFSWVADGNFYESLLDGSWNLMPGLPHPRNLKGCEFLASFEVKSLLGVDICTDDPYRGLKLLCPQTCGCRQESYSISTDSDGREVYNSTDGSFVTFSYRRTDLSHCPASCIVPHGSVDGNTQFDEYGSEGVRPRRATR